MCNSALRGSALLCGFACDTGSSNAIAAFLRPPTEQTRWCLFNDKHVPKTTPADKRCGHFSSLMVMQAGDKTAYNTEYLYCAGR